MHLATPRRRGRSAALLAACITLVACAGGPAITSGSDALPGASTVTATPPPDIAGPHSCRDPSPVTREKHGLEARGEMRGGQPAYALFDGVTSLAAGTAQTTYLRVPGARILRITLVGPDDRLVRVPGFRPGLPPFPWDRSGDPWIGTLTFPRDGCWRVYLARADVDGELWVSVR